MSGQAPPTRPVSRQQCLRQKINDQTEREAVGERAVKPASQGMGPWLPIREPRAQRSDGPSERSALIRSRAPRQLSLVTFFFARKESYPPPGRRSPLKPQKKLPKDKRTRTENAALNAQASTPSRNQPQALISRAVIWYLKSSGAYESKRPAAFSATGYMKNPSVLPLAFGNTTSCAVL